MADTIITNSPEGSGGGDGGAGWFVALVVIIGLVVGGVLLYRNGVFNKAAPADTNINVTLPTPDPKPADSGTAN